MRIWRGVRTEDGATLLRGSGGDISTSLGIHPSLIRFSMFAFGLHKITALAPVLLGAAAVAGMPASASSQQVPLPQYTVAQADAGEEIFQQVCASCHEPDLTGGDQGPPLSDAYFASSWGGYPVAEFLSFVRDEMPLTGPGSLSDDAYVEVISYILSFNGIPAGGAPLAMGASGVITIVAKD